jgi:tetratricopeptide (TPR) repeat protein
MILMLMISYSYLNAQDNKNTELKVDARRYFSEKNFAEALPIYRQLLNEFPKEPEYLYCTGVCLVQLNGDMEEAIRLLRPVTGTEYSNLSWYYLGRAFHLHYAFDDAIKAYSRFVQKGKAAEIKQYDVERYIEMARNGIEYTRLGHQVTVQQVEAVKTDDLQIAAGINGTGKLMKKPVEFCSKTDIRNGYRPWMFLPSFTEINEYVFVSGYEPGKKNNKQIFRIRNINHETWGFPEPLNEGVNTSYDEEYPFFDARNSTLYFSSK